MDTRNSIIQRCGGTPLIYGYEKTKKLPTRYFPSFGVHVCISIFLNNTILVLGPTWLPILGSALTIRSIRRQTGYLYRTTIYLAELYGPIVGLKVGKDRQVVCCGYNAVKEMLTKEEFDGRPQGPFYETRTWGIRRGIFY